MLVVEDHEPFRRFISLILHERSDLQIICEVADGLEAVRQAERLQPDLILLDVGLPTLNGIEAARRIRKLAPDSKILFVSMESSTEVVQEALNLGAWGYVLKSLAGSELLAAIAAVVEGKQFVSSALTDHVLTGSQARDQLCSKAVLDAPVTQRPEIASGHPVQVYSDDDSFLDDFKHFITSALYAQNVVVVVLSESHRVSFLQRLKTAGVDVAAAVGQRRYIALNVPDCLPTVNSVPERSRFARVARDVIADAARAAKGRRTRVAVG